MKKFTLLIVCLLAFASEIHAQCINTLPNPSESIISNNSGDPQEISSCVYTGNFSTVSNINLDQSYIFSLASSGEAVEKYITVTDINNNVIAHGLTPLTVENISYESVRVHYSENAECETEEWCLNSYVTAILSCPFPTDILINNVTTTNATFSWIPGGTESSWQVLVLPIGDDAPTLETSGIVVEEDPEYSVDNLTAANQYQFYIRSNCESEFSPWRGPYNFNSGCVPVEILNENFDTLEYGDIPSCWNVQKVGASSDTFVGVNGGFSNSAPNTIQIANGSSASTVNILLISPQLSTVTTGTHRLKFYARGYGNVSVQVGTVNTMTADAVFTSKETINATANFTEYTVDFTDYEGTNNFIAFRHANTSTYNPIFLDDIRWELAPLCPDLDDIMVTEVTTSSATIGWEPGGSETQWDVVYSDTIEDPTLLTPVSPSPSENPEVTINGLQPNTTYKAWIRSSCGEEFGVGAWMNPVTFTTPCVATSLVNENFETTDFGDLPACWSAILGGSSVINSTVIVTTGNGTAGSKAVALSNSDEGDNPKIILVSPHLNTVTTGTHRLKFHAKSNSPATIEVGTVGSPAQGTTFTSLEDFEINHIYSEFVVDYTTYSGTDNYVAIRNTSGQYITVYVDNFRWEIAPLCDDVTAIQVQNVTSTAADVNWTSNDGETQWDLVYGTADVTDPTSLTPISPAPSVEAEASLSALTPDTAYKLWVRSACGGDQGNGAWIGPIDFRTACLPTGTFSEGFETTEYGDLPNCWSAVLAGPTIPQNAAVRTVNNDAAFGTNAVELHANNAQAADVVMLVSPYLNTLSNGTHRLKFYARSYNDNSTLQVGTLNGNSSQATFTVFQPLTLQNNGYNEYVIDFENYSGADTYIGFRNTTGNYNSIFLDNIRWEINPSCPDVSSLTIADITDNSATVSWTEAGDEPNWQVVHGLTTVTDPSTLTPSEEIDIPIFGIDGLEDNTSYNVWVRSVCGGPDGFGAWIGPVVFRTKCSETTVPYAQDFQSVSVPNLPDCVTLQTIGSGNSWDTTWGDSAYGFEGYVLRYNNSSVDANAWFFTQGIQLTGGSEYTISYKYGNNSNDNYAESLHVLYGSEAVANAMTEEIADHPTIDNGMAMMNEVTFTPETSGIYYFGFNAYSSPNQGQLFLDDIEVTATLSNPDFSFNSLVVYPNPVKDILNVSNQETITNITIFNMLGQKVLEYNLKETNPKIDMSSLSSGSYLAKITSGNSTKTMKVIKE